jgi:hypothetical protein
MNKYKIVKGNINGKEHMIIYILFIYTHTHTHTNTEHLHGRIVMILCNINVS